MKSNILRLFFLIMFLAAGVVAQQDSSRPPGPQDSSKAFRDSSIARPGSAAGTTAPAQTKIRFPDLTDRLFTLAVVAVSLGGLGLILNEKRKRKDGTAGLD